MRRSEQVGGAAHTRGSLIWDMDVDQPLRLHLRLDVFTSLFLSISWMVRVSRLSPAGGCRSLGVIFGGARTGVDA